MSIRKKRFQVSGFRFQVYKPQLGTWNLKLETWFSRPLQAGFTLVELVLFIAIMGIAVAGVLKAYDYAARDSADPVVKKQALAIAESLLEEIQQMPFTYCDPDDPAVSTAVNAAGCATPEAMGPEAGESRYSASTPFDNVNDYNGFNTATDALPGIRQIDGTLITGLGGYSAAVTVAQAALGGIAASDSLRITVTVTGPAGVTVTLDGYRTQYAPKL
jgi:MSHA pilin protein MshD